MKSRTLTLASFFSVAMAATLLGALYTTQVRRPQTAQAAPPAVETEAPAPRAASAPFGLDTFRDIAKRTNDGVVNVNTSKFVKQRRMPSDPFHEFFGGGNDDLLDRFFGGGQGNDGGRGGATPRRQRQQSLGSGFVVDKDGYILTNRHVIEGADEVSVTFPGGRSYDAKIVGQDARTDVALIKIEPTGPLTVLPLGDSEKLEVGEWVMAVGNPFGLPGGGNSVTVGVVSYMGRDLPLEGANPGTRVQMIQTDAAINPGNSGGPLINSRGEVVGINTLIVTGGGAANAGVGFSVPINVAKEILPQLREKGRVTRGWMGVSIQPVSDELAATYGLSEGRGAYVASVEPGSPAEKAGVQPEDVVLSADGREIRDNGDLSRYIASKAPGVTVRLEVQRGRAKQTLSVTLGTFPDRAEEPSATGGDTNRLGMTLRDLTPQMAERLDMPRGSKGVLVMDVEAGEAAEEAGLQRGNVIVSVNGQAVEGVGDFERLIDAARKDGRARLRVRTEQGFFVAVLKLR